MTEEFFDYIFLNKGAPKNDLWKQIKLDFEYWYPVDINLGGKEHKTVHFPVYLMNHVAIMPYNFYPKGLFVHWWVTQRGKEKISKSKGGAEPIVEAAKTYGVDAMRLYYAHVGSPFIDIEWNPESVLKYRNRLTNIYKIIFNLLNKQGSVNIHLDNWLISVLNRHIKNVVDAFENFNLRVASNEIFFECLRDIQWYLKRGGGNKTLLNKFVGIWIILITPITPHLAEELWHALGNTNFVSNESYPISNKKEIHELEEVGEYLIQGIINDINEILKVTKITPKKICIYISPFWKKKLFTQAMNFHDEQKLTVGTLMKQAMSDPHLKTIAKNVSQFAGKLPGEIKKLSDTDKNRYQVDIDEKDYLNTARNVIVEIFSCDVQIFNAADKDIYDPSKKSTFATPLRPAIYIE
jgi:leucyl-tRNA synthetase